MTVAVELPDLGEGVEDGELVTWHVAEGDAVAAGEAVADVETDKAAVEVPAPAAGRLAARQAAVGDVVEPGATIASIEDASGEPADAQSTGEAAPESTERSGPARTFAPPSVRRLARERGVDIAGVDGSGPGGRITEADVRDATAPDDDGDTVTAAVSRVENDDGVESAVSRVEQAEADAGVTSAVRRVDTRPGEQDAVESAVSSVPDASDPEGTDRASADARTGADSPERTGPASPTVPERAGDRREAYDGARRQRGERLATSWRAVPHATYHDLVDASELVAVRERLAPLAAERGVEITATPVVATCVARALAEHPLLAARFDADAGEVVFSESVDVRVAVRTEQGASIVALENADRRGLIDLAETLAGAGGESGDEEPAPAFTMSAVGAAGGEYATPIVPAPATAILALGSLKERPVAADGAVQARPTLPLSLAVDARVVDGATATAFLETLSGALGDPTSLLLD